MPRPKKKKVSPTFSAYSHSLSEKAKNKLIELLGYSATSDAINNKLNLAILSAEKWLGAYSELEKNVDGEPRAADYVAEFTLIHKEAGKLYNSLTGLNGYYSRQFEVHDIDSDEIEKALATLFDVSGKIIANFKPQSSKGARRNTALTKVIRELRIIFHNTYQGSIKHREKKGGFESLAVQEKRELEFVYTALQDARIIPKTYDYKLKLPRLFRDVRCALPGERDQVIDRLARKARTKR